MSRIVEKLIDSKPFWTVVTLATVFGGITLMLVFGYQQYDPLKDTITATIGAVLAKVVPMIPSLLSKMIDTNQNEKDEQ